MDDMTPRPDLDATQRLERYEEPELYVEPAAMNKRDVIGVVVALIALAAIGFCGYVWLNPDLNMASVMSKLPHGSVVQEPGKSAVFTKDTGGKNEHCPICSMFADRSASHLVAAFGDGTVQHFDSWDCAFTYAKQKKLTLVSAQVAKFGEPISSPSWLTAVDASYLYGTTESVEGSMPPGVAAFASAADATESRKQLGGDVVNFDQLMRKWDFTDFKPGQAVIPKEAEAKSAISDSDSWAEKSRQVLSQAQKEKDSECPVCGMYPDRSSSHIIVLWSDGKHSHFDSWDCVFNYERDNKQMFSQGTVEDYRSPKGSVRWLDATQAFYVYGASEVAGSMPPYIAAFATRADAEAEKKDLGGTVVDFAGLRKSWSAEAASKQT